MIAVETDPGYIFTKHRYELSKTEEEDLRKVLESLKKNFTQIVYLLKPNLVMGRNPIILFGFLMVPRLVIFLIDNKEKETSFNCRK